MLVTPVLVVADMPTARPIEMVVAGETEHSRCARVCHLLNGGVWYQLFEDLPDEADRWPHSADELSMPAFESHAISAWALLLELVSSCRPVVHVPKCCATEQSLDIVEKATVLVDD
jgi:hypothetical protein